eukprot:TRINITY_DN24093_c0_g1_i1.p1 TRINITY_DN24093_c0_g1~~TRINITY_DN24093_c0_g1_i1.p1  ORF type:complete len:165 (-),score=40.04 TRINITY_DN24093_c0_g1_i1:265-759(-)
MKDIDVKTLRLKFETPNNKRKRFFTQEPCYRINLISPNPQQSKQETFSTPSERSDSEPSYTPLQINKVSRLKEDFKEHGEIEHEYIVTEDGNEVEIEIKEDSKAVPTLSKKRRTVHITQNIQTDSPSIPIESRIKADRVKSILEAKYLPPEKRNFKQKNPKNNL